MFKHQHSMSKDQMGILEKDGGRL